MGNLGQTSTLSFFIFTEVKKLNRAKLSAGASAALSKRSEERILIFACLKQ